MASFILRWLRRTIVLARPDEEPMVTVLVAASDSVHYAGCCIDSLPCLWRTPIAFAITTGTQG